MAYNKHTLKNNFTQNFVIIPRELLISNAISWRAKGLLCYMLDKPNGWEFTIEGIVAQGKDKVTSVKSAIQELKNAGALQVKKIQDPNTGRFIGYEWDISNFQIIFPKGSFTTLGNPAVGESTTSNTQVKKDSKEENKDAQALCDFLLAKIKEKKPNFSKGASPSWRKEAEKLLKIRTLDQLQRVIEFMVNDDFMGQWTFSMAKVAKHLDAAEMKMTVKPSTNKNLYIQDNKKYAQSLERTYSHLPKGQAIEAREEWLEIKVGSDRPNPEMIEYKDLEFKNKVEVCLKTMGLNG